MTTNDVPLPEPEYPPCKSLHFAGESMEPLYTADQMRAYGDERERAALARIAELEAKLAEAEASDRESIALYHRARDRADAAEADTRRIEWLALNPRGAFLAVDGEAQHCIFWGVASAPENTLRQAIDAAIAAGGGDERN